MKILFTLVFITALNFFTGATLNTNNIPQTISVPKIDLVSRVVVLEPQIYKIGPVVVVQYEVDDDYAGWHDNSAQLGQVGNTVINGHSDTVFKDLHQLELGDIIILRDAVKEYHYKITNLVIVREGDATLEERAKNGKLISPTTDERLTILTCYGQNNVSRLIITAFPIGE